MRAWCPDTQCVTCLAWCPDTQCVIRQLVSVFCLHLGVAGGARGVAEAGALVGRDVRQPGVERLVGLDQSEVSMVTGWPGLRQSQLTWARPSSISWRQDMTPSSATSSPAA